MCPEEVSEYLPAIYLSIREAGRHHCERRINVSIYLYKQWYVARSRCSSYDALQLLYFVNH